MTKQKSPIEICLPLSDFETELIHAFRATDAECYSHIIRFIEVMAEQCPKHKKPMLTLVQSNAKGECHV